mgnify:CR=1 FL=1
MTDPDYWTISEGWLAGARKVASPNYNCRPEEAPIQLIVLHNISLPPGKFGGGHIEALFTNTLNPSLHPYFESIAHLRVSAHFLVTRLGEIVQFVSSGDRAWHAGESHWCGQTNCNDFSIGIEMEGADNIAYTDSQYDVLTTVTQVLLEAYPLMTAERIVGHRDIAPGRKTDPGPAFDWARYKSALS